ncbi:acetyltransferase [Blastomyces silverae]|uniref:Acetyltransferase n=1 Tax=Blastomyces silverae TaxID=2060906 RepID=A0A0H1B6J9_9EURO|nr:acetyltransferase [Blastomyces silverae]
MPALHEDPAGPLIFRTSGELPYPDPANPQLPSNIYPRQVTLRDRVTVATLVPFCSPTDVPLSLLRYLCDQLNKEIDMGDTYPMIDPISLESFGPYWFSNFGAVMLLGDINSIHEVQDMERMGTDWKKVCLGSFNIKPNYPGRSSHVCNGSFLVTDASRNRGVGRLMGECYLEWAPLLGYTYSVFNLVYETNVASCRIWDALGFKRIGKVPGCGNLRSHPNQPVDAIIYGRDLGPEGEDFVSEERFDKIRYYLKHSKYPSGADRAEKSRLRSAATHYKLVSGQDGEPEKLMLKDKEVVSDPQQQYEIARQIHLQQHGGINKTTATIALKYHWVRIKETVSMVIKNCPQCKETPKVSTVNPNPSSNSNSNSNSNLNSNLNPNPNPNPNQNPNSNSNLNSIPNSIPTAIPSSIPNPIPNSTSNSIPDSISQSTSNSNSEISLPRREKSSSSREQTTYSIPTNGFDTPPDQLLATQEEYEKANPFGTAHPQMMHAPVDDPMTAAYADIPLDPQIMDDIQQHLPPFPEHDHHHNSHHHHHHHSAVNPYGASSLHNPHSLQHEFDHSAAAAVIQHQGHPNDYQVPGNINSQAAEALRQQTMRLVNTGRMSESDLHQELLNAAFGNPDENPFST